MRMSVKQDDPGYHKHAKDYTVFIDQKEIKECHTADEELGKAWINDIKRFNAELEKAPWAKYDDDGNITNDLELHSKELIGKVEIRKWIRS